MFELGKEDTDTLEGLFIHRSLKQFVNNEGLQRSQTRGDFADVLAGEFTVPYIRAIRYRA